jgi:hypothetical protein
MFFVITFLNFRAVDLGGDPYQATGSVNNRSQGFEVNLDRLFPGHAQAAYDAPGLPGYKGQIDPLFVEATQPNPFSLPSTKRDDLTREYTAVTPQVDARGNQTYTALGYLNHFDLIPIDAERRREGGGSRDQVTLSVRSEQSIALRVPCSQEVLSFLSQVSDEVPQRPDFRFPGLEATDPSEPVRPVPEGQRSGNRKRNRPYG